MASELLTQYDQASAWATEKIAAGSGRLDAPTPCEEWDLRTLLNHMLETQRYFAGSARGEEVSPPGPTPPEVLSADPGSDFEQVRQDVLRTYADPSVVEKTGPALGIAFADMLLHGWDVARATEQDASMPTGLAQAAYDMIHGRFTDEQRAGTFGPEIAVGADASPQEKLLAYTGRAPQ